ncbi:TPA: hypothetical protein DEG75_02960 [Candidatus Dependentiae bacterium]|nr:hypothetical protein [Candidatus Dependentiae bacterium]
MSVQKPRTAFSLDTTAHTECFPQENVSKYRDERTEAKFGAQERLFFLSQGNTLASWRQIDSYRSCIEGEGSLRVESLVNL